MKYLLGPITSRRLGRSLGINLLTHKTCSFDCVYCECGRTTVLTKQRAEFVPTQDVITELDVYLAAQPSLDWITFSGSGEPTLHSGIGQIIAHLKNSYPQYRVAILTNSTLLGDPDVQNDLQRADLVVATLNAVSEPAFEKICRQISGISAATVIAGIGDFKKNFRGSLVVEVFVIPGVNDTYPELEALRGTLLGINPDRVQLNELDRPGTEKWVTAPPAEYLEAIADRLSPLIVEIVRARPSTTR